MNEGETIYTYIYEYRRSLKNPFGYNLFHEYTNIHLFRPKFFLINGVNLSRRKGKEEEKKRKEKKLILKEDERKKNSILNLILKFLNKKNDSIYYIELSLG